MVAPLLPSERLPPGSRYELLARVAAGGMGTVFVGRRHGAEGFRRLVAIKRTHAEVVREQGFANVLVEEAKSAAKVHHANVVAVLDVEAVDDDVLLVMEYVEGASIWELLSPRKPPLPGPLAVRILLDACAGLQAVHQATDEHGAPLSLVHRDVSPQNVLVGVDGVTRLTDFGLARTATHRSATALCGKYAYMAPEYVRDRRIDARADVFGLGAVAWEALTRQRLFRGSQGVDTLNRVLSYVPPPPSALEPSVPPAFDAVVMRALAKDPIERFSTARELLDALERSAEETGFVASHARVADHVRTATSAALERRRAIIRGALAHECADTEPAFVAGRAERSYHTASMAVAAVPREEPARTPPARPRVWRRRAALAVGAAFVTIAVGAPLLLTAPSARPPQASPSPMPAESAPAAVTTAEAAPVATDAPAAKPRTPPAAVRSVPAPPRVVRPRLHPAPRAAPAPRDTAAPNPYGDAPI